MLWEHRDAGLFWPLCLKIAGSTHVLASLAIAARLINVIRAVDDLVPLEPLPGRTDQPNELRPEQKVVHHIVGALRASTVLPDATPAIPPLAILARRLAENTGSSYADAALATDLLVGLQLRVPLVVGDPGADDRGHAVAALLDGCRSDHLRMEKLAGGAAGQLPHTVGASAAARCAVDRLLGDHDTLQQWGGTVLPWLADAIVPAASHDPDLARRMAAAVLTFRETRDEQVSFSGGALLAFNESRQQQAKHGTYRLGRSLGRLCAANLGVATEIFCDLADDGSAPPTSDQWLVSVPGAAGWLQYGQDLDQIAQGRVAGGSFTLRLPQIPA